MTYPSASMTGLGHAKVSIEPSEDLDCDDVSEPVVSWESWESWNDWGCGTVFGEAESSPGTGCLISSTVGSLAS